jgi:hypothetical protein
MGGGLEILPMALSMGSKLFGGSSAQAAPAAQQAVSPFSMGLMGQPPAGGAPAPKPPMGSSLPPVPERNPMFSDPAGDARGAKMIEENPMLKGAFAQAMSTPRGQPPITPAAPPPDVGTSMVPPRRQIDKATAFDTQPDTRTPSVFGRDVTGQNWQPSKGNITLPASPPTRAPVQAATASAAPAPEPEMPPVAAAKPSLFSEQQFDTAAPGPSGMGVWDTIKGGLKTAQGKLKGIPTNPMAQVGLSLMSSGYDGSNPYKQMLAGLSGIQPHEIALRSADIASAGEKRKADDDAENTAQARQLQAAIMQMLSGKSPPTEGMTSRRAEGAARYIP